MYRHMVPMTTFALVTATLFSSTTFAQVSPSDSDGQAVHKAVPVAQPLTLSEAIRLALQFSPQIVANQQELAASEGAVIQAGARPNPEVQALLEDTRRDSRTTTVQLSQPIELGGKRSARISVAEAARAQTAVDIEGRRAQIRADVADALDRKSVV